MPAATQTNQVSLFYLDESDFSNSPNEQRAWAPKGNPHRADTSSGLQRINVIGGLEFSTGRLWYDLNNQSIKTRSCHRFD
ncbi:transposase [Methylomonas koyamae]|uniref:transposase n=1 Tax=Methylomonas koyamae TaxID=702114 RepID=UPI0012F64CDC|nr:transposase [Methylomonas koyamae]BBL57794.1 hypothetical protein MKFW12EY_14070 [Methylomonas koyamae]